MKLLSHTSQLRSKTKKSPKSESRKSHYKGFARDGSGNTRPNPNVKLKSVVDCSSNNDDMGFIQSHIDYLRIRLVGISPETFESLTAFISGDFVIEMDTFWSPGSGVVGYPNKLIGARGAMGGFYVDDETGLISTMISLSGEYFEGINVVDQWRLCLGLIFRFNVRVTRLDTAIDDPSYFAIPIADMVEACEQGHNFGFKKIGYHSSGNAGDCQRETRTFGSRESGKFVRAYDHDGECLRLEAEFKRGYPQPILEGFAKLERPDGMSNKDWEVELQKYLSSVTVGAIDFRDRGNRKDKTRAGRRDSVRLPFYQNFIDLLQTVHYRVKLPKRTKSISKSIEWVKRQCAPTLSMIYEGMGKFNFNIWLKDTLDNGTERLNNEKHIWIKDIQRNPKMYMT